MDTSDVTFLDYQSNIDQVVIDASRKYLSGICHDSLNKLEGPNYKVSMFVPSKSGFIQCFKSIN